MKIGSFCSIAKTAILLTGHDYKRLTTYYLCRHVLKEDNPEEIHYKGRSVNIGNDVWLGYNTIILDGVRIGDGAVIGAGSVVTHDIEPYAIYAGNPAHFLRWRFSEDTINRIQKSHWWQYDLDHLKQLAERAECSIDELVSEGIIQ